MSSTKRSEYIVELIRFQTQSEYSLGNINENIFWLFFVLMNLFAIFNLLSFFFNQIESSLSPVTHLGFDFSLLDQ